MVGKPGGIPEEAVSPTPGRTLALDPAIEREFEERLADSSTLGCRLSRSAAPAAMAVVALVTLPAVAVTVALRVARIVRGRRA